MPDEKPSTSGAGSGKGSGQRHPPNHPSPGVQMQLRVIGESAKRLQEEREALMEICKHLRQSVESMDDEIDKLQEMLAIGQVAMAFQYNRDMPEKFRVDRLPANEPVVNQEQAQSPEADVIDLTADEEEKENGAAVATVDLIDLEPEQEELFDLTAWRK